MRRIKSCIALSILVAFAGVSLPPGSRAADLKEIRVPDGAAQKAEKAQKASQAAEKASAAQKANDKSPAQAAQKAEKSSQLAEKAAAAQKAQDAGTRIKVREVKEVKEVKVADEGVKKAEKASQIAEKAAAAQKAQDAGNRIKIREVKEVKVADESVKKAEKASQLAEKAQKAQDAEKRSQSASKVSEGAAQRAAERAAKADQKVPAVVERVSSLKVVGRSPADLAGNDPGERTRHTAQSGEPVPDLGPKADIGDRLPKGNSSNAQEDSKDVIDKATGLPTGPRSFSDVLANQNQLRARVTGDLAPAGGDQNPGGNAGEYGKKDDVNIPAGSAPGNPVNDVESEGVDGLLGDAAESDSKTGRTGKDTGMISDDAAAPATPSGGQEPAQQTAQKPAEEPPKQVVEFVDSSGKKTTVKMNPDGKTYSFVNADGKKVEAIHSKDERNYLFTDSDGNKTLLVREQDGSYKTVAQYDKDGNLWYNEGGYMFPAQISYRPEGERGSAAEYMKFLRDNPAIARQLQQTQAGRPASHGGGGDITPVDEAPAASAAVIGEANKRAGVRIQEHMVGNPGAQGGGLVEGGTPRSGPNYGDNNGAGVTDTGGDYTRRGGIQQKEGDFMQKKPTQGISGSQPQGKDDNDQNDDQESSDDASDDHSKEK